MFVLVAQCELIDEYRAKCQAASRARVWSCCSQSTKHTAASSGVCSSSAMFAAVRPAASGIQMPATVVTKSRCRPETPLWRPDVVP